VPPFQGQDLPRRPWLSRAIPPWRIRSRQEKVVHFVVIVQGQAAAGQPSRWVIRSWRAQCQAVRFFQGRVEAASYFPFCFWARLAFGQ
jgi:hypothetical protein